MKENGPVHVFEMDKLEDEGDITPLPELGVQIVA